jgi:hypothetical protein
MSRERSVQEQEQLFWRMIIRGEAAHITYLVIEQTTSQDVEIRGVRNLRANCANAQ